MKKVLLSTVFCAFTLACFSCGNAMNTPSKDKDMKKERKGTHKPAASIEKVIG